MPLKQVILVCSLGPGREHLATRRRAKPAVRTIKVQGLGSPAAGTQLDQRTQATHTQVAQTHRSPRCCAGPPATPRLAPCEQAGFTVGWLSRARRAGL